jgi:hypothetical protein
MTKELRALLLEKLFPYVDVGIEFSAKCISTFRHYLMLNTFSAEHAQQVLLAVLEFPKRKKS